MAARTSRVLALLVVALLLVSPMAAFADYFDNFDQYPPSLASPWHAGNAWTISYDSPAYAACFTGSAVANVGMFTAFSGANVYFFHVDNNSTCYGAVHYVRLSISINASQESVFMRIYENLAQSPGLSHVQLVVADCGDTIQAQDISTLASGWHQVNGTKAVVVNPCNSYIELETIIGTTPSVPTFFYADNLTIRGANAVYSDADLFLINFNTRQWMNITGFPGSKIVINYTGTTPAYVLTNVTAPDVNVPLVGATLVTVYVGNLYYRSLIPTSTTHQIVWLDDPLSQSQTVYSYFFQVLDFSQQFVPGSTIQIFLGTKILSSGYLDSNHFFSAGLVPGHYKVKIFAPSPSTAEFDTTANLSPNINSVTITIPQTTVSVPASQQSAISCLGFWASNLSGIFGFYRDATGTTSSVDITLRIRNATFIGLYVDDSFNSPGPYGNVTVFFPVSELNLNNTGNYYVDCAATNTFGTFTYPNANGQPVLGGRAGNAAPALPDVLHMGVVLPNVDKPTNQLGGLVMLTGIATAFGEFVSPIGFIVFGFVAAFLTSAQWIEVNPIMALVLTTIAVLGFLVYLERRNR